MSASPCPSCGNRNAPDIQFCTSCGAYLGWIDEKTGLVVTDPAVRRSHGSDGSAGAAEPPGIGGSTVRTRDAAQPWGVSTGNYGWDAIIGDSPAHAVVSQQGPRAADRIRQGGQETAGADADPDLRVEVEQSAPVVVTPGAAPVPVTVHIANTSTVVEAYQVTTVNAPPWLIVAPGQVRLLPGTDERVQVALAIATQNLVPAHRFRLMLRVQGESSAGLYHDVFLDADVGEVIAPAQLRLEPSNVRIRDETTARFRVLVDNRHSNVPIRCVFTGRDPEQQTRFTFHPVHVEVPPAGHAAVDLRVDAPLPPPGEQINRTLTVVATMGSQELTVNAGLAQTASAVVVDPPIVLRLDPSVVHAHRRSGVSHVILDNRRGSRPQRIHLEARDLENSVRFSIQPQDLEVPAGQYAVATVTMQAPRPEPGEEASRSLIVTAWNGRESVEAQGQLVQRTAAQRPFLRVLLTALGSLGMIVGSLLPWTVDPAGTGVDWNHPRLPQQLGVSTGPVDYVLSILGVSGLVSAVVSVGGIVMILGGLAAVGIFGTSGRLIRGSAVWGAIVLLLFALAMVASLLLGRGFPAFDYGWGLALVGCVLAFVGSFFASPRSTGA